MVIDISDGDLEIDEGETYEATFRVGDEDSEGSDDGNPYVANDTEESVSTEFSAIEADATFDNVANGNVQVTQNAEATVSGTTNVAPGSEITVELRKTGENPFLETQTIEVSDDGTWSATFDTSAIPVNTEFTVSVAGDDDLAESSAVIVEQVSTEPPVTTEPSTEDSSDEETTTTGEQPGFGIAIAIVALVASALLAAALLSIRRE